MRCAAPRRRPPWLVATVASLSLFVGCSTDVVGDSTDSGGNIFEEIEPPPLGSISVEPSSVVIAVGTRSMFRGVVRDSDGFVVNRVVRNWFVRDTSVVMLIDTDIFFATIEAKAVGTTHVVVVISENASIRDSTIVIVQ